MPRPANAPVLAARLPAPVVGALLALIAAAPPDALAHAGGDRRETRVAGVCGRGAAAKLKLKADDGAIEAEFEVQHNRPRTSWRGGGGPGDRGGRGGGGGTPPPPRPVSAGGRPRRQ